MDKKKSLKNKLVRVGAFHLSLAILIGFALFLVTGSREAGILIAATYWISSFYLVLNAWHWWLHDKERETNGEPPPGSVKIPIRPKEAVGMVMLGLVLGLFTFFLFKQRVWAFLVTFLIIASALCLHRVRRAGRVNDPENSPDQQKRD